MFRIFVVTILLFIPAAAAGLSSSSGVSSSSVDSIMVPPPTNCATVKLGRSGESECHKQKNCCTEGYLKRLASRAFCTHGPDSPEAAMGQYHINEHREKCHFSGYNVINVQMQLSLEQQDFLQNVYLKEDQDIRRKRMAFFLLQVIGGHVGLAFLVTLSILSRNVQRDWTFFNFCVSWIFSSVAFSLLLYDGTEGHTAHQLFGSENSSENIQPSIRCLVQASLINAVQVMTSCSTMVLVIQLWLNLRTAIYGDTRDSRPSKIVNTGLFLLPYLILLLFTIPSIFTSRESISTFSNIFYCTVMLESTWMAFLRISYAVTSALLVITFVFDVLIVKIMYLYWKTFRRVQEKQAISLSVLLRVIIFSIYRIIAAGTYFVSMVSPQQKHSLSPSTVLFNLDIPVAADLLQATIPLAAFLILGTNKTTVKALRFWRNYPSIDEIAHGVFQRSPRKVAGGGTGGNLNTMNDAGERV